MMEKGQVLPRLSEEAITEGDRAIIYSWGNTEGTNNDTAVSCPQSCCELGTLPVQIEIERFDNGNNVTNGDENCNYELVEAKHEQSSDELDFTLFPFPSPPSASPGSAEPCQDSKLANTASSLNDKLDYPPSALNSLDDKLHITDIVERRNESSDGHQVNIQIEKPNSATRLFGPCSGPSSDDQNNRAPTSTENINVTSSSLSERRDSYTWNLASSNLPSMLSLNDGTERLIWPVKEEFPGHGTGFQEGDDYVLRARIAKGAFGECFMATECPLDKERHFCVKKCQLKNMNELLVLTLARRENVAEIVQFYGAKLTGKSASIFMEFMEGGTIAELVKEKKEENHGNAEAHAVISELNCLWYLEDILKGLSFLHNKGIVHRDLKGGNALLTYDRRCAKLADFGSAASRRDVSTFIDIWKTGCFFLEMWSGERPARLLVLSEGGYKRQNSCRPEDHIPSSASQETKNLLRLCFGVNGEEQRNLPSAAELLKKLESFPSDIFSKRNLEV